RVRAGRVVVRNPIASLVAYSPTPAFIAANGVLNFSVSIGDGDQAGRINFTGAFDLEPPCEADFATLLTAEMAGQPAICPAHVGDVFVICEQAPNHNSRVRLVADRDRFGLHRIELNWSLSEIDFRTFTAAAMHVGQLMAKKDTGRLQVAGWILDRGTPTIDQ